MNCNGASQLEVIDSGFDLRSLAHEDAVDSWAMSFRNSTKHSNNCRTSHQSMHPPIHPSKKEPRNPTISLNLGTDGFFFLFEAFFVVRDRSSDVITVASRQDARPSMLRRSCSNINDGQQTRATEESMRKAYPPAPYPPEALWGTAAEPPALPARHTSR